MTEFFKYEVVDTFYDQFLRDRTTNFCNYCKYLNLVKKLDEIFLQQIENAQVVTTVKLWVKYIWFSLNFTRKATILSTLKGNDSCKMYIFRIKVGNVQIVLGLELGVRG